MFGSQTLTLQRIAMKLLSQCASSSGCERNWSSFGFIHTKLHNKLGHNKLHKLVFVNYNLRLRIQRAGSTVEPSDFDPVSRMMDLSFYYCRNAIQDWMEHGRSNAPPVMDEDSDCSDTPLPSQIFTSIVEEDVNLDQWATKNVGDTHLGKRKTKVPQSQGPQKRSKKTIEPEDEDFSSGDTTPDPSDDDDADDRVECSCVGGSSSYVSPMRFTGETDFTHATQDQDHGQPTSQRTTRSNRHRSTLQEDDSSSSVSTTFSYYEAPNFGYEIPEPMCNFFWPAPISTPRLHSRTTSTMVVWVYPQP
jgi:hypothetical protein